MEDSNSKLPTKEDYPDDDTFEKVEFDQNKSETVLQRKIEDFKEFGLDIEVPYSMKAFQALDEVLKKCKNLQHIKKLSISLTDEEYDGNEGPKLKLLT